MSNIDNLQEMMRDERLDLLLLSSPANLMFSTGLDAFPRPNYLDSPNSTYFAIVPQNETPILLVPQIEELSLKNPIWKLSKANVEYYGESYVDSGEKGTTVSRSKKQKKPPDLLGTLVGIIKKQKKKSARIGAELDLLPTSFQDQLRKKLPSRKFKNAGAPLKKLRMVKSEEEISLLRESIRANELACSKVIAAVSEDVDVLDLARIYERALLDRDARLGMASVGAGSKNGAIPIARPRPQKLKKGDMVRLDLCGIYKAYWSDMARTLFVGEASNAQRDLYNHYRNAERVGIESVKAGKSASEVYKTVQKSLTEANEWCPGFVGHGLGLDLHEEPNLGPSSKIALEQDMVLSIEVFYFREGVGGLQIEDNVLVTKDGYEPLTSFANEIIEVP